MVLRRTASRVLEAERRFPEGRRSSCAAQEVPALDSFVPVVNLPFAIDRAIMRSQVKILSYSISPNGADITQGEFA